MGVSSLELVQLQAEVPLGPTSLEWLRLLVVQSLLAAQSGSLLGHPQAEAVVQSRCIQHFPLPETEIQMQLLEAKCILQSLMF